MSNAQRNHTIDLFRLMAAFFVVCLHHFTGSGVFGGEEIVAVSRFAVPLFFLFSGYFSAGFDRRRKLRQILRMFLLMIFSNLAYLALDLMEQPNAYMVSYRFREIFTPKSNWRNFLLFNQSPISEHLWFLGALLYCLLLDLLVGLLWELLCKKPFRARPLLAGIAGALLAGGLVLYHVLTNNPRINYPLYAYRSCLLFGLPFFLFGKLMNGSKLIQKPLPAPVYAVLLFAGCGLTLMEYKLLGVWELYLDSILLAFTLMHLALCHPLANGGGIVRALGWLGQYTTLTIYIVHIYVLRQVQGLYWAHLPWQFEPGLFHLIPLGVFLISLAVGVLVGLLKTGLAAWKKNLFS